MVTLLERKHLRTGQTGVADPAYQAQSEDQVVDTRPQHAGQSDGQQNAGEGEKDVDHPHQHQIRQPPPIRGQRAQQTADCP